MSKIYYNLKEKKYKFLEDVEVTSKDIHIKDIEDSIVLEGANGIKKYPNIDFEAQNKESIQNSIKNQNYKPVLKCHEDIIASNYRICPHCGESIDIDTPSGVYIFDAGINLENVPKNNLAIGKVIECPHCGISREYYYDLFMSRPETRAKMAEIMSNEDVESVFIKYRHIFDTQKHAYAITYFDFEGFSKRFKDRDDMITSLKDYQTKFRELISMLEDEEMIKYYGEVSYLFSDIYFEAFASYKDTLRDFKIIEGFVDLRERKESIKEFLLTN